MMSPRLILLSLARLIVALWLALTAAACGRLPTPSWDDFTGASGASGGKPGPAATATPRRLSAPTPTPASALGVAEADLGGVQITLWHPLNGEAGKALESLIAEFNTENEWGIQAQALSAGSYDRLYEQFLRAAGEELPPPQLALAYTYQGRQWQEALVDLTPYLDDPLWGLSRQEEDDFIPTFWQEDLYDGLRLGIPGLRYAQMLFYNHTWAQDLGFTTPPQTPEEFREQACAAAQAYRLDGKRENDGQGGWLISTGYSAALGWMQAFGAQPWLPAGEGYAFDTPEVQAAFTYLRELYDQGCAWLSASPDSEGEFAARKALFIAASLTAIPRQEAAFADLSSQDRWRAIPFPAPAGEGVIETYGPSFLVMKSTPRQQLASWLLIRRLASTESQARLAQAGAHLPVRASSLEQMGALPAAHPQWAAVAGQLTLAHSEPAMPSWRTVRWAVSDAATQIFRSYFSVDQVPALTNLLDQTANEFHSR
jgi:ABC-type glycerol-3-phosphate transport system substrate-binding protein